MKVEVRLFASLRNCMPEVAAAAPGAAIAVEIPEGGTVADLLRRLGMAVPDTDSDPGPGSVPVPAVLPLLVLVNGRQAARDARLSPGDAVDLFPPLGGG